MNLEQYRIFYSVVNHKSISKAAQHLYISQPAVSKSMHKLEADIGCVLFERTPKGIKLTSEGTVLYQYIEQAFNFINAGEKKIDDIKNLISGEVRIGVSDTLCKYYLVPYLKKFNTLHPEIKIKVTCPTTPGIINLLKNGKIDFGIINMPYEDENLDFRNVLQVQDCFIAGEKYKHLCDAPQTLETIAKYPVLLLEKNSNSRVYMDKYFLDNSVAVVPDFELGNMDLLVHFAKNDFGIACVIKNFIEEDLKNGQLYEIKPIEEIPPRSVGITWLKNVPLSKASSEIINLLSKIHR
jgi:DNA-binding transcriptional LysR family regulator